MDPFVSVIIPNYNYAHCLQKRIDSITEQTIKPAEIIFLDDCSTDNSVNIAEEILNKTNIPFKIITNKTNHGVFSQWLKGINLATHDLCWIAECDDYCKLNFLETLVQDFEDPEVVLAYCQSKLVTSAGKFIASENEYKSAYFDIKHWQTNFITNGLSEINNYMAALNTIPNASAVIFNKTKIDHNKLNLIKNYVMCGDWFFYINLLSSNHTNKLSYVADNLNNYVRHENSVFANKQKWLILNQEVLNTYQFILDNFEVPITTKNIIYQIILEYFSLFKFDATSQTIFLNLIKHFPEKLWLVDINTLVQHNKPSLKPEKLDNSFLAKHYRYLRKITIKLSGRS